MKKLFVYSFLLVNASLVAQNRSIIFEHGDLAAVYSKAKKENKLIFVDAYTSWCGPCKWMARNIFTNDTVADHFNAKYVNYKLDMEKGEGIEFAKKYQVQCYPSLLILNADGKLVNRVSGAMQSKPFISFSEDCNTERSFVSIKNAYEKDRSNPDKTIAYIQALSSACQNASAETKEYFKHVKESDLTEKQNWELFRDNIDELNAREMQYFLENYAVFENKFGKEETEYKLADASAGYFMEFIRSKAFDAAKYEQVRKDFLAQNWPVKEKLLFQSELRVYQGHDKKKYFELLSNDGLKYYDQNAGALNSMAWEMYENVDDKNQLQAAVKMAARACELSNSYAYMDTHAAVLYKSGQYIEAEQRALKAIEKAKEEKMESKDYKDTEELLAKIRAKLK